MQGRNQNANDKIDGYTIHYNKFLGQGAFATCYECSHQTIKCPLCVKVIKLNGSNYDEYVLREITILGTLKQLDNVNIVKIFHIAKQNQICYIFMEKCIQGNLKQYQIKMRLAGQQLSLKQILNIIKEIISGYHVLYSNSIIHRDLKPENLLVGNDSQIKLADYGLGKVIQNIDSLQQQTMVGTPMYASPQVMTNGIYSAKCDAYSLGVIIFELVYGILPVKGRTELELTNNMKKLQYVPLQLPQVNLQGTIAEKKKIEQFLLNSIVYSEQSRIGWVELFQEYLGIKNTEQQRAPSSQQEKIKVPEYNFQEIQTHKIYIASKAKSTERKHKQQTPQDNLSYEQPKEKELIIISPMKQLKLILDQDDIFSNAKKKVFVEEKIYANQQIQKDNKFKFKITEITLPKQENNKQSEYNIQPPIAQQNNFLQNPGHQQIGRQGRLQKKSHDKYNLVKKMVGIIFAKYQLVHVFLKRLKLYKEDNCLRFLTIDYQILQIYLLGYQSSLLLNIYTILLEPRISSAQMSLSKQLDSKQIQEEIETYRTDREPKIQEQKIYIQQQYLTHNNQFQEQLNQLSQKLSQLINTEENNQIITLLHSKETYFNSQILLKEFIKKFRKWKSSFWNQTKQFDVEEMKIIASAIKISQLELEFPIRNVENLEESEITFITDDKNALQQYIDRNFI